MLLLLLLLIFGMAINVFVFWQKSLGQRKDKDGKIKSAVVVTKSTENIEDIWPEPSGKDYLVAEFVRFSFLTMFIEI